MKRIFLYVKGVKRWNSLLRKFQNLYKRMHSLIGSNKLSERQHKRFAGKLQAIYKRLERMQHRTGIKIAGTALALMLASTANAQFTEQTGVNNPFNGVDVGKYSTPAFADIDNDGDFDAFIGEKYGR